jgi:two-component system, NtrC family, sensor kinase
MARTMKILERIARLRSQPSLRGRIAFAYAAVALLTLAVSLLAYVELRLLEDKLQLRERVAELSDTAMEIRRFERNFFLHGQAPDYRENAAYRARMLDLLRQNQRDFTTLEAEPQLVALRQSLGDYQPLMDAYVAAGWPGDSAPTEERRQLEPRIRTAGQNIVAASDAVVMADRKLSRSSLASVRALLFLAVAGVAVLMVAVGQALSRRVAQPLKQIEESVNAVASGQRTALAVPGNDREVVSIVGAFNQMLKELEVRQKHLLRAEKLSSMGTMVSGVAHELNNPLANIWSSCQVLAEDKTLVVTDAQREQLRQVDEQCVRARSIVRTLQDFTRDRELHKEKLPLEPIVRQTLRFLKNETPTEASVSLGIPIDLVVEADKHRLVQILLNLIRNALEAIGPQGKVAILARRHEPDDTSPDDPGLEECRGKPAIDIRIRDNGHGIPAATLPRIFDPFFTTKDVGKGMGLGLFIAYRIVEEHGGCIAVHSEVGAGTTFIVRLPLAADTQAV